MLTKGIDSLEKELEESGESLIDPLHGHGSQCLTNLMICGIATSNVFDGDRSLEGFSKFSFSDLYSEFFQSDSLIHYFIREQDYLIYLFTFNDFILEL